MAYDPEDIRVLSGAEAIRKRPGMYLGDTGRVGALRLIQCAIDVLAALSVNRRSTLAYLHHAFLDVALSARHATVVIDHHPGECPDIAERCRSLAMNRENLLPDAYVLDVQVNSVAPIAVLSALSDGLRVTASPCGPIIGAHLELPNPKKGAYVAAEFTIGSGLDPTGISRDYLDGFLEGARHIPGLLPRNIKAS